MATRELERAYEALDRALGVAEDLPRLFSAAMGAKDVLAHRGVQAGMGRDELSKHHRKLGRVKHLSAALRATMTEDLVTVRAAAAEAAGGATKGQGGGMSRAERRGYAALLALVREKLAGLGDTVRLIFRNFDKDHSGTVDYDEFAKAMGLLNMPLTTEQAYDLAGFIDEDGDGEIEYHEFAKMVFEPDVDNSAARQHQLFERNQHLPPHLRTQSVAPGIGPSMAEQQQFSHDREEFVAGHSHGHHGYGHGVKQREEAPPAGVLSGLHPRETPQERLAKQRRPGAVDRQLLASVRSKLETLGTRPRVVFRSFDADHDGRVSYDEFCKALEGLNIEAPRTKLMDLARFVDTNGDGDIEFSEFAERVFEADRQMSDQRRRELSARNQGLPPHLRTQLAPSAPSPTAQSPANRPPPPQQQQQQGGTARLAWGAGDADSVSLSSESPRADQPRSPREGPRAAGRGPTARAPMRRVLQPEPGDDGDQEGGATAQGSAHDEVEEEAAAAELAQAEEEAAKRVLSELQRSLVRAVKGRTHVLRSAFRRIDGDQDGIISHDELARALFRLGFSVTEPQVRAMSLQYDPDRTGGIEYEEFCEDVDVASGKPPTHAPRTSRRSGPGGRVLSEQEKKQLIVQQRIAEKIRQQGEGLRDVFEEFDADGSGTLDADELALGLTHLGIFLSDDDFHSLIRKVDTDGDGTISWAEFRDAFGLAGSGGKALPSGEMPGGIFYSAAGHSHSSPTYRTSVLSGAQGISAANPVHQPPTPAARQGGRRRGAAMEPPRQPVMHPGSHNKAVWSHDASQPARAKRRSEVALQQAYHPLAERTPFGVDPSTGGTRGVSRGAPNRSRFSFSGAR